MSETIKMTRAERFKLGQLIRKRERVMKSQAAERAALMLAEFDAQISQLYEVIANGLVSAAAREFIERMPSLESLMPQLDVKEMNMLSDKKHAKDRD